MTAIGDQIGPYRVIRLLGQGGMGQVYLGEHTTTHDQVAIKVLLTEALADNPDLLQRFKREGEALSLLNHPNIVKMLDVIEADDKYSIILEYVEGGTLDDLLANQDAYLPLERVIDLGIELADALTRAHHLKIIHRDLKPANILLTADGKPRLTDFGLVRMDSQKDNLTRTGVVMGSVSYLSPEALNNAPPDPRMDIWAFGVVLYEMLAGKRPFERETTTSTLAAILTEPFPDLAQQRDDLPLALVELVEQMLEKDPQRRVSSTRQVGAELEKLRSNLADAPRAVYSPERRAAREARTSTHPQLLEVSWESDAAVQTRILPTTQTLEKPRRAFNRGWMLAGLACVLVIVAGLFLALQGESQDAEAPTPTTAPPAIVALDAVEADQMMVVVAKLEALEDPRPTVDRFILDDLRQTIEVGIPYSPLRIRDYPLVILNRDEAARVAQANQAAIVVWGTYTNDLIEVEIQLNDTGLSQLPAAFLETTGNVRVRLTDEREQSLTPQILVAAAIWQAFAGDAYEAASSMLTFDELQLSQGQVTGVSVATHVYRHYQDLYHDTEAAIASLDAALRLDPSNPMLYHLRAAALDRVGRPEEARQDIQTAILLSDNQWVIPYVNIANVEVGQGNVETAIEQLGQAIAIAPDDWLPYTMRGSFYFLSGDYANAKVDLEASVERDPKANFPYVLLMNIAVREGELDKISVLMDTVLNQFPDPSLANRVILTAGNQPAYGGFYSSMLSAFSNMALQQYDDAVQDLEAAVKLRSDIPEIFLFQGIAYCVTGENERAEAAYTKGIALDEDFTVLYLLRADSRQRQNKLTEALQDFRAAQGTTQWPQFEPVVTEAMTGGGAALGCEGFFAPSN